MILPMRLHRTILTMCLAPYALGTALAHDALDESISPAMSLGPTLNFAGQKLSYRNETMGDWQAYVALSGLAAAQSNTSNASPKDFGDVSNAQFMLQKTSGWLQLFAMGGAYSQPALASNYTRAYTQTDGTWGFFPVGWITLAPSNEWQLNIGKLFAIGGGENTFTYQNINIQRGLLWTQTNVVTRGMQLNYQGDTFSANLAWTDGSYSNTYNWLSGQLTVPLNERHSLNASWTGSVSANAMNTMATPLLQNNSQITTLNYGYNNPHWSLSPYLQMTVVPAAPEVGILGSSGTRGAAILGTYRINPLEQGKPVKQNITLPLRLEYLNSWGNSGVSSNNLMYGPNSAAWSATLTPTWQRGAFFTRLEGSYVRALNASSGASFGLNGNANGQARIMLEAGILY
jgi:hypothetical protein